MTVKKIIHYYSNGKSLWRSFLNYEISTIRIESPVLDIGSGGVGRSSYHDIIQDFHTHKVYSIDITGSKQPHVIANIEQGLPFVDGYFKTLLAFNILEHIYEYKRLAEEMARILSSGACAYIAVPFLNRVHGDPDDYFRYTGTTLHKLFLSAGFSAIDLKPLGFGATTGALRQVDFLIPRPIRPLTLRLCQIIDLTLTKKTGYKHRNQHDYPLGYFVTAVK